MKKIGMLLIATWVNILTADVVFADTVEASIIERIHKVGSVCIEGDSCAAGSSNGASVVAVSGGGAEANYKKTCSTCHAIGVAGAPKLGDVASWAPRIAKGMGVLYSSVINGMPPGMPAKGMCFTCSDDDLKAIVDYMVDSTK
ncbi:MAG: c-type cytochrome [bacterium]